MEFIFCLIGVTIAAVAGFLAGAEYQKRHTPTGKAEDIKKLADDMYNAAAHLTTDASYLRKAMDAYHTYVCYHYYEKN